MNDPVLRELKVIVERAVRPVRASRSRKRRIREELLDHLATIHGEELKRTGDEQVAIELAKRRFGDSAALTQELQASVPGWDCVPYVLDVARCRPGEPWLRLAFRHLALSVVAMIGAFLLILPVLWLRGRSGEIDLVLHILLVLCFFSATFSFLVALFGGQMGRMLYGGGAQRRTREMILYCLASLTVFPLLAFFTYWGLLGSFTSGLSGLILGCIAAPAAPLLFFVEARQLKVEIEHESQWADIEIEE